MPYRRYKKKIYRKRPSYRRRNTSGWQSTAVQALRTAKWVASLVNTEFKYKDTQISHGISNSAYNITPLTLMAQGDDSNQRNGRSVLAKALEIQVKLKLLTTVGSGVCRVVLVRDTTCDGALPDMSNIFDTITTDNAVNSFRNISTAPTKKYQIWWDKRFSLDIDFKDELYISKYIKLKKSHVKYIGSGSTNDNLGPGSFFLCTISTSDVTNAFTMTGFTRFRYIDN